MPDMGSIQLTMLWASAVLGVVHLLAGVIPSVLGRGLPWAVGPRDEPAAPLNKTGERLQRAYRNFFETFPLFAAAVLVQASAGGNEGLAVLGAQLYFWGRVAFLPIYALGLPVLRTLAWTVALAGIVLVLIACLPGV